MKQFIFIVGILIICFGTLAGQTITIEKLPETVDDFLQLRNKTAHTAEGGAAVFLVALKMYQDNPEVGKQCLVIAADRSRLSTGDTYKGFSIMSSYMGTINSQLSYHPYVANSYFKGANPENGYTVTFPAQLDFSHNRYSGDRAKGTFKVFVNCYGADSPRPITLKRNDKGIWKASEWSSVIMGIRKPVETTTDDL